MLPEWISGGSLISNDTGRMAVKPGFLVANGAAAARFMRGLVDGHEFSSASGLLQSIDPVSRLWGAAFFVLAGVFAASYAALAALLALAWAFCFFSGVSIAAVVKRAALPVVFTAVVAAPAVFDFITPGTELWKIEAAGVAVTAEGLRVALVLTLRVAVMASFVAALYLTTSEAGLFTSMKSLPVPAFFISALFMTKRYSVALLRSFEETTFAKRSRTINPTDTTEGARWSAARMAFIFDRSMRLAASVSMAMESRGFRGEVGSAGYAAPVTVKGAAWVGLSAFVFFLSFGV